MEKKALIVGVSGVIGNALSEHLLADGWTVYGLSRGRTPVASGCIQITADLTDPAQLVAALGGLDVHQVFFTAWARQANEKENIRVNGAMVQNVLDAVGPALRGGHAALVTGLKHYLGPFEAYGTGNVPQTPFREEQGRQEVDNFYYEQEDRLFDAAERHGFSWSVHRPNPSGATTSQRSAPSASANSFKTFSPTIPHSQTPSATKVGMSSSRTNIRSAGKFSIRAVRLFLPLAIRSPASASSPRDWSLSRPDFWIAM